VAAEPVTRTPRIRGWTLLIIGASLSIGMAALSCYLGQMIMNGNQPGMNHWTGSHVFTVRVLELFGAVFLFGLVALAGGIVILKRGRISKLVFVILLALVAVMFYLGATITNSN
jgi:hypothetical protein